MGDDDDYKHLHTFAGNPRTTRGRPSLLHVDPKGNNILYCNGNSIFIRNIHNPSECDVYTHHSKETTVAAYSPSGYYICSADISGKIRIWDTVNKEHILKYDYQSLGGVIKDVTWSEDSKRIALCGEGREQSAVVINWDTGTSCGTLNGPVKACNSISFKQQRPYRLAVASEDHSVCFYEGPPFKFKDQYYEHTNFANCVRFSPDGAVFATGGADGKCFIHDGKTGQLIVELNEAAGKIHNGGIYGMAWSPDSKHLMTCSADKTVKIWVMDQQFYQSNKEAFCFKLGNEIGDMQVGCAWIGTTLISLSLNGNLNYLDCDNVNSPKKIVKGHTKAIITSCVTDDNTTLFTASFDGLIYYWDLATGVGDLVEGNGHRNQVQNMCVSGSTLITCGMDDTVRFVSISEKTYLEDIVKLQSQPQRVAVGNSGMAVVACLSAIVVLQDKKIVHTHSTSSDVEMKCIAINSNIGKVAVGTDNAKVVIYDIAGTQLKEYGSFPTNGNATDIKFSPDGQYLGLCTGKKQVKVVFSSDFKEEKLNQASHAVKVNSIAWSPSSKYLASCGIDGVVYTWDVEKGIKEVTIRGAHSNSVDVTSVQWSSDNNLITTGRQDCSIRVWEIKH